MNTMPKMHTCFNTQPPEGGWKNILCFVNHYYSFNTQPPEGGWDCTNAIFMGASLVSTHSRLKAAGT